MTHARPHEARLGDHTWSVGNPDLGVEHEQPVLLDRAVDGVNNQPRCGHVATDYDSWNPINQGKVSLKLFETYRSQEVMAPNGRPRMARGRHGI